MSSAKPLVGITTGEVAGVGPEIAVKAFHDKSIHAMCVPVFVGEMKFLRRAAERLSLPTRFRPVERPEDAVSGAGEMAVIDLDLVPEAGFHPGRPNAVTGQAMLDATKHVVQLAIDGRLHGGVGGPHSKLAAEQAGHHFDGYPGLIASMTNSPDPFLMLVSGELRVTNVTLHLSLRKAIDLLSTELVLKAITETCRAVRLFGVDQPRIAVAGLNPHAGEGRMFGDEDEEVIAPAVAEAKRRGITAEGPFPADSLFYDCLSKPYDAFVAMYHDQAHIPVKVLAFKSASAVAIGVPINWATVDHGCALDIAWQGTADAQVLVKTIKLVASRTV